MTAKRAIWIIRAILYPSLALAAALLLLHRGGESEAESGPRVLIGRTSQDRYFAATLRDGRLTVVNAYVHVQCPDHDWYAHWTGREFAISGDRVRLRATAPWDTAGAYIQRVSLDARRQGARLTGTFESVVTAAGDERELCTSGRVAFDVHE